MPLSEHVLTELARIERPADEDLRYGPFNALLYTLFPVNENFVVAAELEPIYPAKHIRPDIFFHVDHKPRIGTVLFLQMRHSSSLEYDSSRRDADTDMRNKIRSLLPGIVVPKIYALSMMGTRFAVYEYVQATNSLFPPVTVGEVWDIDVAPETIWEYDILEAAGQKKIKELVAEIKQMCEFATGHCGTTNGQ